MTISVLLPTRNRLDYLTLAVETVRRQDSPDWEILISDNDSSEDIESYVLSVGDERIRYRRAPRFLPVTDNWNAALEMSRGDYVLMMGDDDAVLPGYMSHMQSLVSRFDLPDLIYVGSLLFTYPGVSPSRPEGFLVDNSYAEFITQTAEPFVLERDAALGAVRRSMAFRHAFNFNMQLSLVSRRLIDELKSRGEFFQSPFPDFYATSAALLKARTVVIEPSPQVVIGVTPKSYGFFHLNDREEEGRAFLSAETSPSSQAPGTNINEGWLAAMELVEANYGQEFGLRVNRRRYRRVQAGHVYTQHFRGSSSDAELQRLHASLRPAERVFYKAAYGAARAMARLLPRRIWDVVARRALGQYPGWKPEEDAVRYRNILEVFEGHRHRPQGSGAGARPQA